MRIVIVNKFYYRRGGDCVCAMDLENLLRQQGHEVAFFSMDYSKNISTPFQSYFPSEVSFSDSGLICKLKAINRLFAPTDVVVAFKRLLEDFRPQIVHLHNIHSYLSPIIAKLAKSYHCKVVWTLHDYKLICPAYSCLSAGGVCEACFSNKFNVVLRKCMKNSLPASILAFFEALYWNREKVEKYVDYYICPSSFMKQKMIEGRFDERKLIVIHNFIQSKGVLDLSNERKSYCYVGRLSSEKGIATLLRAAQNLPYPLQIVGSGPLLDSLRDKYESDHITFLGYLPFEKIAKILQSSKFCVVPSVCYENNPLSVIESRCNGTPVLGSAIGGIPELIDESCGMLFEMGNESDLQNKIEEMYNKEYNYTLISQVANHKFAADLFYQQLMSVYESK